MAGLRPPALIPSNTQTFSEVPALISGASSFLGGRGQAKQQVELAEAQMQAQADRQMMGIAAQSFNQAFDTASRFALQDQANQAAFDRAEFQMTGMRPQELDAAYGAAQQIGFQGSRADYVQSRALQARGNEQSQDFAIGRGYSQEQFQRLQQLDAERASVMSSPKWSGNVGGRDAAIGVLDREIEGIVSQPALQRRFQPPQPKIAPDEYGNLIVAEPDGGVRVYEGAAQRGAQRPTTPAEVFADLKTKTWPPPPDDPQALAQWTPQLTLNDKGVWQAVRNSGGGGDQLNSTQKLKIIADIEKEMKEDAARAAEGAGREFDPSTYRPPQKEVMSAVRRRIQMLEELESGQAQAGGGGAAPSAADDVDVYRQSLKDRRIPERFHEPLTEIARQTASGEINPELLQVAEAASTARTPAQKEGVKAFIVQRFPMGDPNLTPEDRQAIARALRMLSEE